MQASGTPSPYSPDPMDTPTELTELAYRFMATGPRAVAQPVPGARHRIIALPTPPGWRDGPVLDLHVNLRGSGPAALLVHGWRGQAVDLDPLADRLVDAGCTVWMPDLPGHGRSQGAHLSVPLAAAALLAVQGAAGPFAFAAAHSYGGAALVQAMATGLQVQRVALLAPPTHYGAFARRAASQAGLPEARVNDWLDVLGNTIGVHPDDVDMRAQARRLQQPALLVHSEDDPVVPFDAVAAVARQWTGARWWPRGGLGHFRLLTDDETLRQVTAFATGPA